MEANVLLFEAIKRLDNYGSTVFNVKVNLHNFINKKYNFLCFQLKK